MMAAFVLLTLIVVAFCVLGLYVMMRRRIEEHGAPALIWRYVSGMPHHGEHLTDAGWHRHGTRALTPTGHASRFWYLPRRKRALRRSGRLLAALVVLWGLLFERTVTLVSLAVAAVAGVAFGIWRALLWWRGRRHHRTWVHPAHLVAAPLAGHPVAMDPRDWLSIEPDRSRVVAELPADFNHDSKGRQRLADTLATKLGIEAPEVRYQLAGPSPRLELTQSAPPPDLVTLDDIMPAIESARPDEVVWGIGKRYRVVKNSLSGDSPHVGLSMGSGAGKSITARAFLAQMLYHGAISLVLDYKMISHQWARNLPNVVIARRPAEIHAALCWLGAELERRNEVALAGADDEGNVRAVVGPRLIVVCEEMNATMSRLRRYWNDVRDKDDPKRSPALDALDAASFMGRQVMCNILYVGQRLSVRASGGDGDARENIGVIAFGRYSASNWKMLAADHPMPPKSVKPGRLQIVAGTVTETQAVKMTAAEAQRLALSGIVASLPSGMPGARATGETVSPPALETSPDLPIATVSSPVPALPVSGGVTLSEAHAAGVFAGLTLAGVRTARHRDGTFPRHTGRRGLALEYDAGQLAAWANTR